MFEAKLTQAALLKHVLDSLKELVTDVNFDCDEDGMKLQAMDNSHVALVALRIGSGAFAQFRCDRSMTLGTNIGSFQKIVKCAANDDILTLRAQDDADLLNIVFETLNTDRVAEYEMKLMDIDIEHLGIPDTIYDAEITLPSAEFSRIIRDLKEMGESVRIEATKEGVKFSANGDVGKGAVMLKHTAVTDKAVGLDEKKTINIEDDDDEQEEDDNDNGNQEEDKEKDEDEEADESGSKVKKEPGSDDEAADEEGSTKDEEDEEDALPKSKKRKLAKKKTDKAENGKKTKAKKGDVKKTEPKEGVDMSVSIALQQSVSLTFSIKYLSNFTKATPLTPRVTLHMSNEVPLLVAYEFGTGFVRYYLAPKIEDD